MVRLMVPIFCGNVWLNGFILLVFGARLSYGFSSLLRLTLSLKLLEKGITNPDVFLKKIDCEILHTFSLLCPLAEILKGQYIFQDSRLFLQEFFASEFQTIYAM
jgi:hypothetical protein